MFVKPCPYCGEMPKEVHRLGDGFCIGCKNKKCKIISFTKWFDTPQEAINAWNEREERIENNWVPVSDGLPEDEEEVIVTRKFLGLHVGTCDYLEPRTYVEVAWIEDERWRSESDEYKVAFNRHTDPIAWMPLPKPYVPDTNVGEMLESEVRDASKDM